MINEEKTVFFCQEGSNSIRLNYVDEMVHNRFLYRGKLPNRKIRSTIFVYTNLFTIKSSFKEWGATRTVSAAGLQSIRIFA